ncbi:MAG: DUF5658 family protein [Gemmataceae bacterium]|nr:DUF5658 family protein [Gemmataceae bacterium]MCI0741162.1 DUF5658 family protein [Gemmataceae bacterium]
MHGLFKKHPLLLIFALLSLLDLTLTWWLLEHSGRVVFEANPIAQWWLGEFGWLGLAAFKSSMVLVVIALTFVISRRRPRVAARMQVFACAVLAVVVCYSAVLGGTAKTEAQVFEEIDEYLAATNEAARHRFNQTRRLAAEMEFWVEELITGQATLAEVVGRIQYSSLTMHRNLLLGLIRQYPRDTLQETLACVVLRWAEQALDDEPASEAVVNRLSAEFRELVQAQNAKLLRQT